MKQFLSKYKSGIKNLNTLTLRRIVDEQKYSTLQEQDAAEFIIDMILHFRTLQHLINNKIVYIKKCMECGYEFIERQNNTLVQLHLPKKLPREKFSIQDLINLNFYNWTKIKRCGST